LHSIDGHLQSVPASLSLPSSATVCMISVASTTTGLGSKLLACALRPGATVTYWVKQAKTPGSDEGEANPHHHSLLFQTAMRRILCCLDTFLPHTAFPLGSASSAGSITTCKPFHSFINLSKYLLFAWPASLFCSGQSAVLLLCVHSHPPTLRGWSAALPGQQPLPARTRND
jgi:hypothetical protein